MRQAIFILSFLISSFANAQVSFSGVVIDAESAKPIPFAHVINLMDYSGTITNSKGEFSLICDSLDIIKFQFLGYTDFESKVADLLQMEQIRLSLDSELIDQITIVSEDGYLYEHISQCRKKLSKDKASEINSKAYLNIISKLDNAPIEFIEAFYNAELKSGSVSNIHFKNGQSILIKNKYGGYFFNVDISKALSLYSLLNGHDVFPTNPLELSKRKLRKKFKLSLESRTKDLIGIAFEPRYENSICFSGKIWMNPHTNVINAIELESSGEEKKSFVGLGESKIKAINYKLVFSFIEKEASSILSFVKLNYDASLITSIDQPNHLKIESEAILHLFDYNSEYVLPYFTYRPEISDYHLFSVVPENEHIWDALKRDNQIKLSDDKRALEKKMHTHGTAFSNEMPEGQPFFGSINWSDSTRIILKPKVNADVEYTRKRVGRSSYNFPRHSEYPVDKLNVDVQLYLDLMPTDTGMVYSTAAILDSYESFNNLEETGGIICYSNIYFDLTEIYRRELVKRITESDGAIESIHSIYKTVKREMEDEQRALRKSAFAGVPELELELWNERVVRALGIDNIGHVKALEEEE